MYRKVEDFINDWNTASEGTLRVMNAITNDKLDQSISEGHNSLGWLANHLVGSMAAFGGLVGFNLTPNVDQSTDIEEIIKAYKEASASLKEEASKLSDESLQEVVEGFVGQAPRGHILRTLIDHQTHHRGQMTVLLRQAGLSVPPIMGPTKEMQ